VATPVAAVTPRFATLFFVLAAIIGLLTIITVFVGTPPAPEATQQERPAAGAAGAPTGAPPPPEATQQERPAAGAAGAAGTAQSAQYLPAAPTNEAPTQAEVKSAACQLKVARTDKSKTNTSRALELIVSLSVPSDTQECHDTVTIDAPAFDLGKEPKRTVSIVSPPPSKKYRWLLEPKKVGSWSIAVETEQERLPVPVTVTTPLGFSAPWVQVGTIAGAVLTLALAALGLWLKRE
jgi:hypothetical protein